jgi:hypothetical protein
VYLVMLLILTTVDLYVCLSGMNIKSLNIWAELCLGVFCLLYSATLFHFCNYAHYFANIVRYQNTSYEHIYGAFKLLPSGMYFTKFRINNAST